MIRSIRFWRLPLFSMILFSPIAILAQSVDRASLEKQIGSLYEEIREKEREFIAVDPDDTAKYAEFLKQTDTGIFRLAPREKYDGKLSIRGGGAYYSFTRLTHEYDYGSDIELSQGNFSVGFAGLDFGFLVIIDDTPLDSVTLEHPGLKFLLSFVPASVEPEIREQQRSSSYGIEANGFTYRRSAAALVNTTYALRSIDYSGADILVAFRVVRRDADGSMILTWKKLKSFQSPHYERNEQE
ncbi:MAG TPA: hypothetical protein VIC84_15755 [Blastocatellia bacterium]